MGSRPGRAVNPQQGNAGPREHGSQGGRPAGTRQARAAPFGLQGDEVSIRLRSSGTNTRVVLSRGQLTSKPVTRNDWSIRRASWPSVKREGKGQRVKWLKRRTLEPFIRSAGEAGAARHRPGSPPSGLKPGHSHQGGRAPSGARLAAGPWPRCGRQSPPPGADHREARPVRRLFSENLWGSGRGGGKLSGPRGVSKAPPLRVSGLTFPLLCKWEELPGGPCGAEGP